MLCYLQTSFLGQITVENAAQKNGSLFALNLFHCYFVNKIFLGIDAFIVFMLIVERERLKTIILPLFSKAKWNNHLQLLALIDDKYVVVPCYLLTFQWNFLVFRSAEVLVVSLFPCSFPFNTFLYLFFKYIFFSFFNFVFVLFHRSLN